MKPTRYCVSLAALLLCAMAGCEKEAVVTSSRQAKDTSSATIPAATPHAGMDMSGTADSASLKWKTPEGWREDPTPRPMREATFLIGEPSKAEVVVTRLSGGFGDFSANINRWRSQVGLDPLQDASAVKPTPVKTPLGNADTLKMEGAEKSMVVAMLKQGEATWFFKLTGDKAAVNDNEAKLTQFLSSLSAGQ